MAWVILATVVVTAVVLFIAIAFGYVLGTNQTRPE